MIVKCPTCSKEVVWENSPFRPFCSERCKLIDLDKWFKGEYSIPIYEDDSNTSKDDENS